MNKALTITPSKIENTSDVFLNISVEDTQIEFLINNEVVVKLTKDKFFAYGKEIDDTKELYELMYKVFEKAFKGE